MLRIEAKGISTQDESEKKGKLFERLCGELLNSLGYKITNRNLIYAGMEIDLEGERTLEKIPFICECKGQKAEVGSKEFQAFAGKLSAKQKKNPQIFGIFLTLSRLNSSAKGFYQEYFAGRNELILLEEPKILDYLYEQNLLIKLEVVQKNCQTNFPAFKIGDAELLYTEKGYFWFQYMTSENDDVPNYICFIDSNGNFISEKNVMDELNSLNEDFLSYKPLLPQIQKMKPELKEAEHEEVVPVRGSSSYFEYQFPASPEYFVGRFDVIGEFKNEIESVIKEETRNRILIIKANSGWGKSSLILKLSNELNELRNIFVVSIDTRTASNVKFLLHVLNFVIKEIEKAGFISIDINQLRLGGYDSIGDILEKINEKLKSENKLLIIFFDQFENIFYQASLLEKVRNFVFKLFDRQHHIIAGFAWKSDLIGIHEDYPYRMLADIEGGARIFHLQKFGEIETQAILQILEREIRSRLRQDLRFQLSEYSQGFPWLLKKLCAHVIKQKERGIKQQELVEHFLNIQELFDEDIKDLSPIQEEALRYVAQKVPISISEIGETYPEGILQSLVDKRLIVRVGPKFDIYWDIFRDYLNTGKIPSEEAYILRIMPTTMLGILKHFIKKESILVDELKSKYSSEKSFYNLIKDARLLGLLKAEEDKIAVCFNSNLSDEALRSEIKAAVKEKLSKHKVIRLLQNRLLEFDSIPIENVSNILQEAFPYIKADIKTWNTYSRILSMWMDFTDYAVYMGDTLRKFDPSSDIRSSDRFIYKHKKRDIYVPSIQNKPIQEFMERISTSMREKKFVLINRSRDRKALSDAIALGFVTFNQGIIKVSPHGFNFINNPDKRAEIFKDSALELKVFKVFLDILNANQKKEVKMIAQELNNKLGNRWSVETAKTVTKILINWVKYAGLMRYKSLEDKEEKLLFDQ
ncbi:MAG: AAA-associated domain-containing protein [Thermodesulfovibrionales bacterium]